MGTDLIKISSLPEEMLLQIFTFVPAEDLISSASKVCSKWNALILGSGCIWNNLTLVMESRLPLCKFKSEPLEFNEFSIDELQQVPNIKSVKIYNYSYHLMGSTIMCDYILSHMSRNCRGVEKIEIVDFRELPRSFFSVLYQCYPKLKVLELRSCWVETLNSYSLLSAFYNLKTLVVDGCDFRSEDLKTIARGKASLRKLLMPFARNVSDESLVQFLVAKRDSLEELSLSGYNITDVGYQVLSQCYRLRELYVNDARKMGSTGLNALAHLPCLRKLTLKRATFPCQVLSNWLQTSTVAKNLRRLDLLHYSNWEPQLDSIMAMLVDASGTTPNNITLVFVRPVMVVLSWLYTMRQIPSNDIRGILDTMLLPTRDLDVFANCPLYTMLPTLYPTFDS